MNGMSQMSKSSKSFGRHSFMILQVCVSQTRSLSDCCYNEEVAIWVNLLLMSWMMCVDQGVLGLVKHCNQRDVVTTRTVGRLRQWFAYINVSQACISCVRT